MSEENKAVEFLQSDCKEVWWNTSRLPSTKQVPANVKSDMVQTTEGQTSGYSVYKRIFNSGHYSVQKVNEIFRKLDSLRDELTIVKASQRANTAIEAGKRIIMVRDISEFEERFEAIQNELAAAVAQVAHCIDNSTTVAGKTIMSIKELDKQKLGKPFNEKDYPTAEDLIASVTISSPQYGDLKPEVLLPPAVLARETERISKVLDDSVTEATNRAVDELVTAMESLARGLSHRVYLDPLPDKSEAAKFLFSKGLVEVLNVLEHRHDSNIPEGSVIVEVSYKEVVNDKSLSVRDQIGPMLEKDYIESLRPYEDHQRRQLRSPAVDKLIESLEKLSRIRAMLGDGGEDIEANLVKVKEILRFCQGAGGKVVEQLKSSTALSDQLRDSLNAAVRSMTDNSEAARTIRRRIVA